MKKKYIFISCIILTILVWIVLVLMGNKTNPKETSIHSVFIVSELESTLFQGVDFGYLLGFLFAFCLTLILPFPIAIDLFSILLAILLSIIIGTIFSAVLANKVAKKELVDI